MKRDTSHVPVPCYSPGGMGKHCSLSLCSCLRAEAQLCSTSLSKTFTHTVCLNCKAQGTEEKRGRSQHQCMALKTLMGRQHMYHTEVKSQMQECQEGPGWYLSPVPKHSCVQLPPSDTEQSLSAVCSPVAVKEFLWNICTPFTSSQREIKKLALSHSSCFPFSTIVSCCSES